MKNLIQKLFLEKTRRNLRKKGNDLILSRYRIAKEYYRLRLSIVFLIRDIFIISLGVVLAGFGLKGFLLPNDFIDGGVTGISLLTAQLTGLHLSVLILIINVPFIILGYYQIGKSFTIKSIIAISGLALAIATINYPVITSDKLLVSTFGGFFLGAGIGFSIRGGSVLDGTEILAIQLSKKTGLTIGDIILIFNILIFSVAAYLLSVEVALYSILTYLAASKTVDFIVEGIEEFIGVTIVSPHHEEIRVMIIDDMGRGVTIYDGKRGHGKRGAAMNKTDIIYTVMTRLEIAKLKTEVQKIDPNAFIVMNSVKDTTGGMIKKKFKVNSPEEVNH